MVRLPDQIDFAYGYSFRAGSSQTGSNQTGVRAMTDADMASGYSEAVRTDGIELDEERNERKSAFDALRVWSY